MGPRDESLRRDSPYPEDAQGSCLVIGIPPVDRKDEALPVDLVRSILYAVSETRGSIRSSRKPDANTRVEVFGAIPRELMNPNSAGAAEAIREVLGEGAVNGGDNSESAVLRTIELERAAMVQAIGHEFQLDDLKVVTLTEKLKDADARREFIDAFRAARGTLNETLNVGRDRKQTVLRQALMDLVPDWQRKGAPPEVMDRLINYALAELLWIVRKATKQIVLFHYARERRYLDLARAYMDQILGFAGVDLVSDYVVMPPEVDGLKLPPVLPPSTKAKRKTLHNKPCEPYRIGPGQEIQRVLIYPADSLQVIGEKLRRKDVPQQEGIAYVREMLVPILSLARKLTTELQPKMRREFARLLPEGVLEDTERIPEHEDTLVTAFYELVVLPLGQAIEEALAKLRNPPSGGGLIPGGGSFGGEGGGARGVSARAPGQRAISAARGATGPARMDV